MSGCVDPLADAITVLRSVKIENPSARPDTEDAQIRVDLALSYLAMISSDDGSGLLTDLIVNGDGYIVRDPAVIALLERVVRCHGCDALRFKHPDGNDAACPWCGSNSSTFLSPATGKEPE